MKIALSNVFLLIWVIAIGLGWLVDHNKQLTHLVQLGEDIVDLKSKYGAEVERLRSMEDINFRFLSFSLGRPSHFTGAERFTKPPVPQPQPNTAWGAFSLEVNNGSTATLSLPANYDGEKIKVYAENDLGMFMLLKRKVPVESLGKFKNVQPGENYIALRTNIDNVMYTPLLESDEQNPEWYWELKNHSTVDHEKFEGLSSPLHDGKHYSRYVTIWSELHLEGMIHRSIPIQLKLYSQSLDRSIASE